MVNGTRRMPFKSEKPRRWMHSNKPEMAQQWEKESKVKKKTKKKSKKKGLLQSQGYY